MKSLRLKGLERWIVPVLILVGWEIFSRSGTLAAALVPAPTTVLRSWGDGGCAFIWICNALNMSAIGASRANLRMYRKSPRLRPSFTMLPIHAASMATAANARPKGFFIQVPSFEFYPCLQCILRIGHSC